MFNKALVVTVALVLSACGAQDQPAASDTQATDGSAVATQVTKETATAPSAMLVENVEKLPTCEVNGTLIYVLADENFLVCDGEIWQHIDIAGKDGEAGKDGVDGKDGQDAEEPMIASQNMWHDPVTGKWWFMGAKNTSYLPEFACSGDWHVPTNEEAYLAGAHGMFSVLVSWTGWGRTATASIDMNGALAPRRDALGYVVYCMQN